MTEMPPPLDNGYVWVARVALPTLKARELSRELQGFRHELRTRDVSEMDDPAHNTIVEIWAHTEDQRPTARVLGRLLAE